MGYTAKTPMLFRSPIHANLLPVWMMITLLVIPGISCGKNINRGERPAIEDNREMENYEELGRPSHKIWDALLKSFVSADGKVNYPGMKSELKNLDAYLNHLAEYKPSANWTREESLAYWINAYNAFTIKLIVDNYPLQSILELKSGKVWDWNWIRLHGESYSLNQIEHEIIRTEYDEPRIHFALVCAAISCPPLLNRAWQAENLESDLRRRTEEFINNTKYNYERNGKLFLSKIFEWYRSDFGNLQKFLNKYLKISISSDTPIVFIDYDWSLNE